MVAELHLFQFICCIIFILMCGVLLLHLSTQGASIFHQFRLLVEKQIDFQIKNLYSDNGGEYLALRAYISSNAISWLTTAPTHLNKMVRLNDVTVTFLKSVERCCTIPDFLLNTSHMHFKLLYIW